MTQYIFRRITYSNGNWKIGLGRISNLQMFHYALKNSLKREKEDLAFQYSTRNRVSLLEEIRMKIYNTGKVRGF